MGGHSTSKRSLCSSAPWLKRRFPFLLLLLVFFPGCGEEEGSPPVLTEFRPPLHRYVVGFNFGQATLNGTVDFEDPDGDVVLLRVTWEDCGREPPKKLEIVQDDLQRTKRGTMAFILMISTDCPTGDYTVGLSAVDGRGFTSNVLHVPYEIYEAPTGG